ncbi:MAG: nitroreductase family protein [Lentisphaeria bacterium]|nr:nitroreductase family protein [Lentisphaeria bacterium]
MSEDWQTIFEKRASCRTFLPEPVPMEKLKELCAYGVKAPTACNMQEWRFVILTDKKRMEELVERGGSKLLSMAPACILMFYAADTKNILYHDNLQSASAAVENMLLAAPQLGLGACWICNLPRPAEICKMFDVPMRYEPTAAVIVGYPSKEVKPMPLHVKLDEIIGENRFPRLAVEPRYSWLKLFCSRFIVLSYRFAPLWVKRRFLNDLIDRKFTKKFDK